MGTSTPTPAPKVWSPRSSRAAATWSAAGGWAHLCSAASAASTTGRLDPVPSRAWQARPTRVAHSRAVQTGLRGVPIMVHADPATARDSMVAAD